VVEVENHRWWDVDVEVDAQGNRFRLGVARSYASVRFRVASSRLGGATHLRLIANPMDTGREAFTGVSGRGADFTPLIDLFDHRILSWTLGSSEATTTLIVR